MLYVSYARRQSGEGGEPCINFGHEWCTCVFLNKRQQLLSKHTCVLDWQLYTKMPKWSVWTMYVAGFLSCNLTVENSWFIWFGFAIGNDGFTNSGTVLHTTDRNCGREMNDHPLTRQAPPLSPMRCWYYTVITSQEPTFHGVGGCIIK